MAETRRKYAPEYKAKILERVKAGEAVAKIATDEGINAAMIYHWIRRAKGRAEDAKPAASPRPQAVRRNGATPARVELKELQRKLRLTIFTQRELIRRIAALTAAELTERMEADILRSVRQG